MMINLANNTIAADHLTTLLVAAKLRRYTQGRTCQLAALTSSPLLETDCHHRAPRPSELAAAQRMATRQVVGPLQRGHVASLMERVQRNKGRAEVLRTWHTGIATLRHEPRYVLHGGRA